MKKIITVLMLAVTLVGCGNDSSWRLYSKATPEEKEILKTSFFDTHPSIDHVNRSVVKAINSRQVRPTNGHKSLCEFKELVSLSTSRMEVSNKYKVTIKDAYKMLYKKDFDEVCYGNGNKPELAPEEIHEEQIAEDVPVPERENVVTIEEDIAVLSPEMMHNLKGAIKSCPRAKDRYMSLTEQGELLTVNFYKKMGGIIHRCQVMEIEKAL
jgi:hypothetical protein